jgi:hypothetical protein
MDVSSTRTDFDTRLAAAIEELWRERRRTADELEALQAFEDRVRTMTPEEQSFNERQPVGVTAAAARPATGLKKVRDAYESTVMSVPHYLEEYDDSYVESLIGEFSPEIASALTGGTEFNSRCKRALLSAVSNAQTARESLLEAIDRERESVHESKADLERLREEYEEFRSLQFNEKQFGTLDAYRARLNVVTQQCEELSERRQAAIFDQRRIQRLPADVPDVTVYFYQSLDVDYPVMSLVAELVDTIADLKNRVERAMTYCHA